MGMTLSSVECAPVDFGAAPLPAPVLESIGCIEILPRCVNVVWMVLWMARCVIYAARDTHGWKLRMSQLADP
jgi:hypothetical protein